MILLNRLLKDKKNTKTKNLMTQNSENEFKCGNTKEKMIRNRTKTESSQRNKTYDP